MEPQPSQRGADEGSPNMPQLPFRTPATLSALLLCDRAHIVQRTLLMETSLHTTDMLVRLLPAQQDSRTDSPPHATDAPALFMRDSLRPGGAWRQVRDVWRALQAYEPNIIHCSSMKTSSIAVCARWLLAFSRPWLFSPAIITELESHQDSASLRRTVRLLRFMSDSFIVESTADRDALMRHRIKSERVHVAPWLYPNEANGDTGWSQALADQMRSLYLAAYVERRQSEAPYLGLVG